MRLIYLTLSLLTNNSTIGPLEPLSTSLINLLNTWIRRLLRAYARRRFFTYLRTLETSLRDHTRQPECSISARSPRLSPQEHTPRQNECSTSVLTHIYVCALAATLVRLCVAAPVTEPHSGLVHGPPGGPCAPD